MAIDVTTEPGATLAALLRTLNDPARVRRLQALDDWYAGKPQLPGVPKAAAQAVRDFHELSSTNLAQLVVEAVRERQRIRGIRTAADDDATGDSDAWTLWLRMRGPLISADVHRLKARFGLAYALVNPPAPDEPGVPIVTAEDPRSCVADVDPLRPWIPRSGMKLLHDPVAGYTRAYLYRPGRLDVAEVATRSRTGARFSPASWGWNPALSGALPGDLMPLVPFEAMDGVGEFEHHLRLLRRIDFMVLQQLTIAVLQAFKQRAIKGVPVRDDKGDLVDYNALFPADPGALWMLPATAEMWESGQVDLSGLLVAARDFIRQLAAATRTPLSMMEASGENQSAEGASAAREGLVFKVEDRNLRDGVCWGRVIDVAGRWLDIPMRDVQVDWAPPQRSSLIERATALAQSEVGGVPFRTRMIEFGEFDPAEVDRMEVEREDDLVFSARVAAMKADTAPTTPPNPPPGSPQGAPGAPDVVPTGQGTLPPATGPQQPAQGAAA